MDVRIVNPLLSSLRTAFNEKLKTEVLFSKPGHKDENGHSADVCVLIVLSGDATGSVNLCFPMRTAVNVATQFKGEAVSHEDPGFVDALSELAGIVAGQASSNLGDMNIAISPPNVIVGEGLRIEGSGTTTSLTMPCDSSLGRFWAEVTMTPRGSG
jgi:chemotaxis protein CheX